MLRKLIALFISLSLCLTTVACGSSTPNTSQTNVDNNTPPPSINLSEGKYPVQQATYDDGNGEYSLMLLNTPPGSPPVLRTTDLQMARITDEEINDGEKTYLEVTGSQKVMHLTEDFKIEYVHNVTETQTNPQTGQQETIVVRRESNFWTPFAGALAGQALGSLLFRPQYYVPPVYQPGGVLTGYGGSGSSYNGAVEQYQSRYNSPPPAITNRQTLRTTGSLRNTTTTTTTRQTTPNTSKSTGSGYGSSNLRQSGNSSSGSRQPSFGSSSPSRAKSGFGSSRRRR
ncbi:MAG: hypothetical protein DSM107014_13445 [Gomphosphaeria aponina SAG 52.96 = DSM 107014]|uniref:Uncharacterized protein n=1 Tax=Gomphosphaeria aponina SAG 52.96 = DSM 107014 TaxID=1521640 RepID=A0A941JQD7_9CHRO|nr:hypothetical protein [Gomphosphaeria aponina SAG 52.96 = DSM 107014]